jgi:hypothetical protein
MEKHFFTSVLYIKHEEHYEEEHNKTSVLKREENVTGDLGLCF